MKLNEMIKKLKTYNQLAHEIGGEERAMFMRFPFSREVKVESISQLKKFLNEEFVDFMKDAILNHDGYEFNETTTLIVNDGWRGEVTEKIKIIIC